MGKPHSISFIKAKVRNLLWILDNYMKITSEIMIKVNSPIQRLPSWGPGIPLSIWIHIYTHIYIYIYIYIYIQGMLSLNFD